MKLEEVEKLQKAFSQMSLVVSETKRLLDESSTCDDDEFTLRVSKVDARLIQRAIEYMENT